MINKQTAKPGKAWDKRYQAFDYLNVFLMIVLMFVIVYPFYYAVLNSFNADLIRKPSFIWNANWTLRPYQTVFGDVSIINGFINSVLRTVMGTALAVVTCSLAAFALSKSHLKMRALYLTIFIIPTFFDGGQIPAYLNLKSLGLLNTFWVYLVPKMFSFFWMTILMTNFRGIPNELEEAAYIDGASTARIFFGIVLPISLPALATIALYAAVSQWNSWYDTAYFTNSEKLTTLSWILMRTIKNQAFADMANDMHAFDNRAYNPEGVKMATMVVAAVPIIMIYPFLQRYFVKGLMVGSIKG
ncbi:MAG: carbohydrate ABC transporter permease [Clostridia bacterium]|nr:carbohydrate ABC transporter permease [Clostridia bacterium]